MRTSPQACSAAPKAPGNAGAGGQRRTERRRHILSALVKRLAPDGGKDNADLVDMLYVLTSFDTFEALSVRNRSAKSVETLMQTLVEQTVRALLGARG